MTFSWLFAEMWLSLTNLQPVFIIYSKIVSIQAHKLSRHWETVPHFLKTLVFTAFCIYFGRFIQFCLFTYTKHAIKWMFMNILLDHCNAILSGCEYDLIWEGVLVILSWSDGHIQCRWCGDASNIIQMATSVVPSLAWTCCSEKQMVGQEICSN